MSAVAIPAAPAFTTLGAPSRSGGADHPVRGGHLEVVRPGFVPAPAVREGAGAPVAARPALCLTARGRLVRSLLVLTAAVVLAVAVGGWLGGAMAGAQPYAGPVERVSVAAGDTVWAIAATAAAPGQDVREVVDDIRQLNGLASSELLVGQQLLVPAG